MSELPVNPTLYWLLNLHCLIGGIAAVIARRKGYRLVPWLFWGLLGGTFAFAIALYLKPLRYSTFHVNEVQSPKQGAGSREQGAEDKREHLNCTSDE